MALPTLSRPSFFVTRIPVRLQGSLLVLSALLAFNAAGRLTSASELGTTAAMLLGSVVAALFIASVLVHELAHAFAARRMGLPVGGIVLSLFGGATDIGEPDTPRQEGLVAVAGPLASLALGIVAVPVGWAIGGVLGAEVVILGVLNLALAAFNLLPGLPLDGGRIARAVLWARSGDRDRATVTAGRLGGGLGVVLLAGGVALMWSGDLLGGLWLVVIATIIRSAGRAVAADGSARVGLSGRCAADLVEAGTPRLPYLVTIAEVDEAAGHLPPTAAVFLTEVDRVVGVLELAAVERLRVERPFALAGSAMVALDDLPVVNSGQSATDVAAAAADSSSGLVLVVDEAGDPLGAVRPGTRPTARSRVRAS